MVDRRVERRPHLYDQAAVVASIDNIIVVTIGNVAGGSLLVAGIYWIIYLRKPTKE